MVCRKRHQRQEREKQRERTRKNPARQPQGWAKRQGAASKFLTLMQLHVSSGGEITRGVSGVKSRVRCRIKSFEKSDFNPTRTPPL